MTPREYFNSFGKGHGRTAEIQRVADECGLSYWTVESYTKRRDKHRSRQPALTVIPGLVRAVRGKVAAHEWAPCYADLLASNELSSAPEVPVCGPDPTPVSCKKASAA